ncbi:hypothetical protein SAMN06265338_106217 [Rhodoblastus acidophilus]|uniref:PilZ domain-containing protein n=1 Tax=Rhodoblastus acidophilus TaxID=1074 RepID=A0A212RRT4_RHOAC|nr:hypothetical protein [Rhodoblastus acidophilus]MCW2316281.1 hypothetical protein [Rhodoblastus acidophilus]PPQ38617.1 hypothetical protein CKO16_10045 [Rhodoblastus acidophilus]RAI16431.1 hypothetical protein CH337_21410 [Rhodoblastus acidophilus]SNB75343.1 hypothetical protein SAMN06265338_106217 [Rhodoblastus acidophilus]
MPLRELIAERVQLRRPSIFDLFRRKPRGEVTYAVLSGGPASFPSERRYAPRRRTRLRSGKILDRANRFLVEVSILDRSAGGLRLRLARDCEVPDLFHLFDDESENIYAFRVIWRRDTTLGARLRFSGPVPATRRQIIELRGKYYAIKD